MPNHIYALGCILKGPKLNANQLLGLGLVTIRKVSVSQEKKKKSCFLSPLRVLKIFDNNRD